jgi:flagellar basal-body rod modification protein FlgD
MISDIASLANKYSEPYTAKASIGDDGLVDTETSTVTGDRTSGLFKKATETMGKDQFLQLLVTQLRYQDPLNPMQNTEFVAQLAQFRSLESSNNIEAAIGKLSDSFKSTVDAQQNSAQSLTNSSAVSMIGKIVRLKQTEINWMAKAGQKEELRINLGNADQAVIRIKDKDGNIIRSFSANEKDSENSQTIVWDGKTDTGEMADSGAYTISIDGEEKNSELYAFVQDTITGVRFTSKGTVVKIGGKELPLSNVMDVSSGATGSANIITSQTAVSMIGKNIRVRQDSIYYQNKDNENIPISINTGGRPQVSVEITDKKGNAVYSTTAVADDSGVADFSWNGITNTGAFADAGEYFIRIAGQNQDPTLYSFAEGKVTGVMNLGGDARLRVGGISVSLSDVIDISEPSAT